MMPKVLLFLGAIVAAASIPLLWALPIEWGISLAVAGLLIVCGGLALQLRQLNWGVLSVRQSLSEAKAATEGMESLASRNFEKLLVISTAVEDNVLELKRDVPEMRTNNEKQMRAIEQATNASISYLRAQERREFGPEMLPTELSKGLEQIVTNRQARRTRMLVFAPSDLLSGIKSWATGADGLEATLEAIDGVTDERCVSVFGYDVVVIWAPLNREVTRLRSIPFAWLDRGTALWVGPSVEGVGETLKSLNHGSAVDFIYQERAGAMYSIRVARSLEK